MLFTIKEEAFTDTRYPGRLIVEEIFFNAAA
jgi:hypothetical protein